MKIEYNNIYVHFVLTTQNRLPFIEEQNRIRIEKYITGIINRSHSRLYAIYANPEHVHLLVSKSPNISEDCFIDLVATGSQKFIIKNKLAKGNFFWQDAASAFSVSKADINKVCIYILNQPVHHNTVTIEEEYTSFIKHYQQNISRS
jgi:putative transposase